MSSLIYLYSTLYAKQIVSKQLHSNKQENTRVSEEDFKYETASNSFVIIQLSLVLIQFMSTEPNRT